MPKEDNNIQNISCDLCSGSGVLPDNKSCPACKGVGTGFFYYWQFFYWGKGLTVPIIELEKVRKKAHIFINLTSFFALLVGLFSLGGWVYLANKNPYRAGAFAFWRIKSPLILMFWVSLFAGMFVFYRLSEELRKSHKIKPLKYSEKQKKVKMPDNWSELAGFSSKDKVEVSGGYSLQAIKTVEDGFVLAGKLKSGSYGLKHLFYASLSDKQVGALFSRLNVNVEDLLEKIRLQLEKLPKKDKRIVFEPSLKEALVEAYLQALALGMKKVEPMNFLLAIIKRDKIVEEILYEYEVSTDKIFNVIKWFEINEKLIANYKSYRSMARFKPSTNMDRAYTSVATPLLDRMSYDLTLAAKWNKLDFCVSRGKELEDVFLMFESGKRGVMLVGDPGIGKRTIVSGIARLMVEENVPGMFRDKRLVELDIARLVSGATPSQAEEKMIMAIDEVVKAGNIILYIENIENIMSISAGGEESLDLSEVLVNALERYNLFAITSVTKDNFTKFLEGKPLGNMLGKVEIDEPEGNKAIQIIESKIGALEGKYGVYFSYRSIEDVVRLTDRYIHDRFLPEKAIDALKLTAIKVLRDKGKNSIVSKEDIASVISEQTKIPVSKFSEEEGELLLNLEDKIHERLVDQVEAVNMVSASLRRARAELRSGARPIANFLFLGPTGVGKTELAKAVSEIYFGHEDYMVRVDMSEYQHPDSVEKMIGTPDGIHGHLTEAIRRAPFSLVLLDEVEKAHPDILNLFLQVMDDGRLTDGQGRTIDFTNSIIIATSNAGALYIQDEVKKGTDIALIKEGLINSHLNKVMRPELVNRFDGVIVFKPLSEKDVQDIAGLMLKKLGHQLSEKGIKLQASPKGVIILAREGFDPKFGARPLRRLLQDKIENEIANKLLAGKVKRRDTVFIDDEAKISIIKGAKI